MTTFSIFILICLMPIPYTLYPIQHLSFNLMTLRLCNSVTLRLYDHSVLFDIKYARMTLYTKLSVIMAYNKI